MKIHNVGLDINPGKYKYTNEIFDELVRKFEPLKVTPYTVEVSDSEPERADAVVFKNESKLDLIVGDMEKIETRLSRAESKPEQDILHKAQKALEGETLLCDAGFGADADAILKPLGLLTYKPCVGEDEVSDNKQLFDKVFEKAGFMLFLTAGKKEVHAWGLSKGTNAKAAAGKIHSDLERGFIKAEIIHAKDIKNFHNMSEAKAKGLVELVDKDYIIQTNDIIEIKFNV